MQHVFIGRQPIIDNRGHLYGYELLCRDENNKVAIVGNGDQESTVMLLDAILSIGLDRLTRSKRAFINVTEALLLSEHIDALPPKNVVLEILETVKPSPELVKRLEALKARHFSLALDDFTLTQDNRSLTDHVDIIKIDVRALEVTQIEQYFHALKQSRVLMLAEKVETQSEYQQLRDMGFDLFQGYYFARPELYTTRALRPNQVAVLQLLQTVNDPNVSIETLANLIRGDVALSIALLRWTNAASTGLAQAVDSIDRAIVTLGIYTIRNWLGLIAMANMGIQSPELVTTVLVRARFCELLAITAKRQNPAGYFTVGLFSALDIMMESPMPELLNQLPLARELKDALLAHQGSHGEALKAILALESGEPARAIFANVNHSKIAASYVDASEWADEFLLVTMNVQ